MTNATLKMLPNAGETKCWDRNVLMINGSVAKMIRMDRDQVMSAYYDLNIAHSNGEVGERELVVGNVGHTLAYDEWYAALECLDQWFADYAFVELGVGA